MRGVATSPSPGPGGGHLRHPSRRGLPTTRARAGAAIAAVVVLSGLPAGAMTWMIVPGGRWQATGFAGALLAQRIPLAPGSLADPGSTGEVVVLVVGTDRRAGQPQSLPRLGRLSGERADSISLWFLGPERPVTILALPRDLQVTAPRHDRVKLSTSREFGPDALVSAVRTLTGVAVHRYVEVDFAGFAALVSAVGGVEVSNPLPLRDRHLGLELPAGRVRLDAPAALRYVRARSVETLREGTWSATQSGDLHRIRRQQQVLVSALTRLRSAGPRALAGLADAARTGVAVDDRTSVSALASLAETLAAGVGSAPTLCVLPSRRALADAVATSPFPPGHEGSAVFRVVDAGPAAVMLGAVGFRDSAHPGAGILRPPAGCSVGGP